jgi:hypothetical protein
MKLFLPLMAKSEGAMFYGCFPPRTARVTIVASGIFSFPFTTSSVQEERKPSLWGPFVNAIVISRGQRTEDFLREYLLRHPEYLD